MFEKNLQSTIPRNPVDNLVSNIKIFNSVPVRIVASELTSSTAACIATLATLPTVELKDMRAPTLTVLGLVEILLIPFEGKAW